MEVIDEDKKTEIINKIKDIEFMNREIENSSSSSIKRTLMRQYGDLPKINYSNILEGINFKTLESASFYYLNLIKSDRKRDLYESTCLLDRVKW